MQQNLQQKKGLVKSVFDTVYNKYDLMNDFMSFGIHRYWKRELIRQINPSSNNSLVDVACGTGDVAKLFSDINQNKSKILCVDFNLKMLNEGKKRLKNYGMNSGFKQFRIENYSCYLPNYLAISYALALTTIGNAKKISGKCREKLFLSSINNAKGVISNIKINVILLPLEGDPGASKNFWKLAAQNQGLLFVPSKDWP